MSDLSKKVQFAQNIGEISRHAISSENQGNGYQLPCRVSNIIIDESSNTIDGFVEVEFQVSGLSTPLPNIVVPVIGWRYIRYPIQVGDAGVTISIDTDTQYISGIYDGIATINGSGNLGPTLAFLPIMQTSMANSDNSQAVVVVGPQGAIIRDDNSNSVVTISPTGIRLQSGSSYIQIDKNGAIDIEGTSVTIMGKDFLGHHHGGVQTGTSNTGGVT